MAILHESGHYAIAGFLYQLIGSGVEALEIREARLNGDSAEECLVLERFGQDAAALPPDGTNRKPKLIQFKHSGKNATIAPADLRKILEGFLRSLRALDLAVDKVDFKLVTNRPYSRDSQKWVDAEQNPPTQLEGLVRKSSQSQLPDASELAAIFQRLVRDEQTDAQFRESIVTAGGEFGMLESEIEDRIQQLIGLLMEKASAPHDRIVRRTEIHKALTGFANPYRLLSEESVQVRSDDVTRFQHDETGGIATIPRTVSNEIGRALLERPFIVVVGDGGSGKSIAASDAVLAAFQDTGSPPGFGLVVPALRTTAEFIMRAVARWRNRDHHEDGQAFERSISRLRCAFPKDPLLVVCIDAIDEKQGMSRLPAEVQSFIRELINDAVRSHAESGVPRLSVVLTCRRIDELWSLLSRGSGFSVKPHPIPISEFGDEELETLANELSEYVRDRILNHLHVRVPQSRRKGPRSILPVSSDVLQAIRHPVIWGAFSSMDERTQGACLDRETGIDSLAAAYLNWFRAKAEIRIPDLRSQECYTALESVARRFPPNPGRIGGREEDWISPCVSSTGCAERIARELMAEALSAGILLAEEEDSRGCRRWRWKHTWLCQYLARDEKTGK
ncbi:MAG: hypothetical protein HQ582_24790 [Planctomycetes bacterium]|nr:hypothetical protein [Planctomycetota bacterium]